MHRSTGARGQSGAGFRTLSDRATCVGPTALALTWLLVVGLALLTPALTKGSALGPYDFLTMWGLGNVAGTSIHNLVDQDQVLLFLPWTTLAWSQVHQGHLPLWDPYSLLGLPLAFNWQSAPFSLPALAGYLVPVRFAYDMALIVKLFLAGSGAFVLCRVLGVGVVAAAFAGTVYELSGAFSGWLGWSAAGVLALTGWVLAGAVLVFRGDRRGVALLGIAVAFSIYGGYPEASLFLFIVLGLFALTLMIWRSGQNRREEVIHRPGAWGYISRLALGCAVGLGLAAPLWLPAAQLVGGSSRSIGQPSYPGLPARDVVAIAFQGFYGLPTLGHAYFDTFNYYRTATYVGVTVLVLAGVALVRQWRRPEVAALTLIGLTCLALLYVQPFVHLVDLVPGAASLEWSVVAQIALDFVLAVLAGLGLEEVIRSRSDRSVIRVLAWAWVVAAAAVAGLFVFVLTTLDQLPPGGAHERLISFVWPAVQVVTGLAASGILLHVSAEHSPRSWSVRVLATVGVFFLVETGFLLWAGVPLWSSSTSSFGPTPAEASLQRIVGNARVGLGWCPSGVASFTDLGLIPNTNLAYGVDEFAAYETIMPLTYLRSWAAASGQPQITHLRDPLGLFCPAVTDVAEAREYGVRFILERPGEPGPPGTHLVATPGGEGLYRVDNVSLATATPATRTQARSVDTDLRVDQPNPTTWLVHVNEAGPAIVHLRLTNVPGWSATVDGRPLTLTSWHDVMLQVHVPVGHNVLVLHYRPRAFDIGVIVAVVTAVLVLAGTVVQRWSRARNDRPPRRSGETQPSGQT